MASGTIKAYVAAGLALLITMLGACRDPQQPEPPADPPTPQSQVTR